MVLNLARRARQTMVLELPLLSSNLHLARVLILSRSRWTLMIKCVVVMDDRRPNDRLLLGASCSQTCDQRSIFC